jgi:hypothetical protein
MREIDWSGGLGGLFYFFEKNIERNQYVIGMG